MDVQDFCPGIMRGYKFNLILIKTNLFKSFKVLLVTGGWGPRYEHLASTEVYRPSAGEWREVTGGALPRPLRGVRVVTLNNRVLLFGEKEILLLYDVIITCIF